ncbi:hypothetical protein [Kitasatospora sp. NPDC008115]|uniref:hypothetical protein n=1 Tax=Kitasatospora sp. NPDC008115 TaxID=3364022 RepID=UPI0036EF17B3
MGWTDARWQALRTGALTDHRWSVRTREGVLRSCRADGHPVREPAVAPGRAGRRPVSALVETCPRHAPGDDARLPGLLPRAAVTGEPRRS